MRPSYKQPYFYVNNITTSNTAPTADSQDPIELNAVAEKAADTRYGNVSKVRMEIRYGKDGDKYELTKIYVDYLKAPQYCNMEQEQLDLVEDTTQIIEFPDYICYQIIDGIKISVLENTSDARFITSAQLSSSSASK